MTTRKMKHRKLKGGLPTIINDGNILKLVRDYINDKQELPEDLRAIPIGRWDVSLVTNMNELFRDARSFNEPIGDWNVSNVINMQGMFLGASSFSQPIGGWNVSRVEIMRRMFCDATRFNQPIGGWNVSSVINTSSMFSGASSFNQPIGGWNVSKVSGMGSMFAGAEAFNQPIGGWDVSKILNTSFMFLEATGFNQPIGGWDVSSVIYMIQMFKGASSFNQPIGDWDVSSVINMSNMFQGASSFNQPIGNWMVSPVAKVHDMFEGALAFKGTKSVNQPICGYNSLFQTGFAGKVTEYLANWRPLECSVSNPANCGPTALKFVLSDLPRAPFQALSDAVQTDGIALKDFNHFFYDKVRHLDFHYNKFRTDDILPNLLNIFRTNLLPGYATLIMLGDPVESHVTTVVRLDQLMIFEGQTSKTIAEDAIVNHVRRYRNIGFWCNKHKNKHNRHNSFEEITVSQPQPQSQSQSQSQPQSFKEIAAEIKRRFPDIDPNQVDKARIHGFNIMHWTPRSLTKQLKGSFDEPTTARIVEMLMQMKNARASEPQTHPQPQSFKKQRHQGGKTRRKKIPVARRSHVKSW